MGQIRKIRTEIDTDPLGEGYVNMDDQQVADSLNALTRSRPVKRIQGIAVGDAVDEAEYAALSIDARYELLKLLQFPSLNPATFAATVIRSIFPADSATLAALVAMSTVSISRATEIGATELVKAGHVEKARAL